jgi:mRNA interferase HigB
MRLLNRTALDRFVKKHQAAAQWIAHWTQVVEQATWDNIQDVRATFPSADGVFFKRTRLVVTVFNVKGNEYRLLTVINYVKQEVLVWQIMTHAEYAKEKWKKGL